MRRMASEAMLHTVCGLLALSMKNIWYSPPMPNAPFSDTWGHREGEMGSLNMQQNSLFFNIVELALWNRNWQELLCKRELDREDLTLTPCSPSQSHYCQIVGWGRPEIITLAKLRFTSTRLRKKPFFVERTRSLIRIIFLEKICF